MTSRAVWAVCLAAALSVGGCTATSTSGPNQPDANGSDELAVQITELVGDHVRENDFSGSLLVARGEEVLFSAGFGLADIERQISNTPSTRFRLASVTKQITATAILLEQARGTLRVDGPICEHVSPCPSTWSAVTIRHLLTHTSGIPNLTGLPEFDAIQSVPATPAQTMALFADDPLDFSAGDRFSYSNSGYILLGIILEHASGRTYEEYVEDDLFAPLGMADSGYEHDGDGLAVGYVRSGGMLARDIDMSVPYAAGALYSSVEDLHRWDRAVADGRLVSATALADGAIGAPPSDLTGFTYGFGVLVGESRDHRMVFHDGAINGFMSYYAGYPDDGYSVVILTNREDERYRALADDIEGLLFGE